MSIPPPALAAFVLLLGWPLIQLISVLVARPARARIRSLAAELKGDERFDADDKALIDRVLREAHGHAAFLFFPILLPAGLLVAGIAELFRRHPPSRPGDRDGRQEPDALRARIAVLEKKLGMRSGTETIDGDARFQKLKNLSFEISVIRSPVSAVVTIIACIPVLPVFFFAYGLREAFAMIVRFSIRLAGQVRNLFAFDAIHHRP